MKQLQIGMASFQELIEDNYVYADKTRHVYELVSKGKFYFLSRPRRFGKSLLLSTFEALFSGPPDPNGPQKGLFQDLWIGRHSNYDFSQKYPIINLSMSTLGSTQEALIQYLSDKLQNIIIREKLSLSLSPLNLDFGSVVESLNCKYGQKVVVLIDEYDAPISENIGDLPLALKFRDVLKGFYSSLKGSDKYLRFVFVTGVTRYALTGLSAGLNQLKDLTFDEKYADICGFTPEEFDSCFEEHLPVVLQNMKNKGRLPEDQTVSDLRKKFLSWYDGYSWDGETRVLNPYSILNCLDMSKFDNYWVNTYPSAGFLRNLIAEYDGDPTVVLQDKYDSYSQTVLGSAEVSELTPVAGLFQTGYLTTDTITAKPNAPEVYSLKIPNWEVKYNNYNIFSNTLFSLLGRTPTAAKNSFESALMDRDSGRMTELIGSVFASLPAIHHRDNESFYHSVLFGFCRSVCNLVFSETPGAVGTPDLFFYCPNEVYVALELKYDKGTKSSDQEALLKKQALKAIYTIDTKSYLSPYLDKAKQLIKIGLGVTYRGKCLAIVQDFVRKNDRQ
ncbi:MAG: ATP-binding protein [Deltaproteobacteria bacterium]|jgi:hypothetical protein|nr:ATP-binding protein [Deltaproteobacteria bacterium]